MNTKEKIFLVDDNMTNLTIGKKMLGERFHVLTLPTGEKLFRAIMQITPDLILLDIDLPLMNGYEILRRLKSSPATAHIPVIFLSARDDSASVEKALLLGAADYILKPYTKKLLIGLIERHLLIRSQQHSLHQYEALLNTLVQTKKKSILELQNSILETLIHLASSQRNLTGPLSVSLYQQQENYLHILIEEMMSEQRYHQEIAQWDPELFMASSHFHDIGKIIIKDSILLKPGRLTPLEFEQIKKHTVFGVQLIDSIEQNAVYQNFFDSAKLFAGSHHEKWDGSGYPLGLHGDAIPLQGRIMAILDVYNALISERPYKRSLSKDEARDIIANGRNTHFDPILTDMFLSLTASK